MCGGERGFWRSPCSDCRNLFQIVQDNLGKMGLGQLMDELIATQIPKDKIRKFLESDASGNGSLLDQILAKMTNDLAQGIGVKEKNMSANDVKGIRQNPQYGTSTKPIDS